MQKILLLFLFFQFQLSAQEINKKELRQLMAYCDSTKADEVLISWQEETIVHWKRKNFTGLITDSLHSFCGTPFMNTASMVKSWTGILMGILIDKEIIEGVEVPVCSYLPEWEAGCKNQIRIRHLLNMTAGLYRKGAGGVLSQKNMNKFVLQLQVDTFPDLRFSYSNEAVQLLGIIMQRASKKDLEELFEEYLFQPLHMDSTQLSRDSSGSTIAYGGCTTTVEDAHQIALLMLNKGLYQGKRLLSEQWIEQSTSPSELAPFYGYLWWIDQSAEYWNYAASGDLGQMSIIIPELQLIFIRKQSCDLSAASIRMSWMGPHFIKMLTAIVDNSP